MIHIKHERDHGGQVVIKMFLILIAPIQGSSYSNMMMVDSLMRITKRYNLICKIYLTTTAMPYPVLTRTNRNTVVAMLVIFPLYIYICF